MSGRMIRVSRANRAIVPYVARRYPAYRAAAYAVHYAPRVAQAAWRIGSWWNKMRARKAGRTMPGPRQTARFAKRDQMMGQKTFRESIAVTPDALFTANTCVAIVQGTGAADRLRNFVDLSGIKLNWWAHNTSTESNAAGLLHVAVVSRNGMNKDDIFRNFFTKPTSGADEGYLGIDFNDAILDPIDKNHLPIWKGRYRVYMHKKYLIHPLYDNGYKTFDISHGSSTVYHKAYIKIKKRLFYDPDDPNNIVQNPIFLCYWWEPHDASAIVGFGNCNLKMGYKLYFKKST